MTLSDNIISLSFLGSINRESAQMFVRQFQTEADRKPNAYQIDISISSPGGEVDIAIELYNFLRAQQCNIITYNISTVNSAAIILYLAGDKRLGVSTSTFYLHSVKKKLRGNYDEFQLLREAKELRINTDRIASILSSNTNKGTTYWRRLMKRGEVLTSEQAMKNGLMTALTNG